MAALVTTLGDGCDHETLADVLAFLDAFDESGEPETRSVAPLQPTVDASSEVCQASAPVVERRHRSRASTKNQARMARYWKHKDELQSLHSTVEYLSNVLEAKKQGSLTLRSLHASPRSAAKQLSKSTGMNWEQRARVERELRRRAEDTNARLRGLAGKQMKWSNMLEATMRRAWWSTWQEYVSCPFKAADASGQQKHLGWASMRAARATAASFPTTWTTSFTIPTGDPEYIGGLWWATVQKLSLSPCHDGSNFSVEQTRGVRITKSSSWSIKDDANEEVPFKGEVAFEVSKSDTHWTLVATADVFDASGTKLLFQTFAARAVKLVQTRDGQVCEFHGHYSVDYPSDASRLEGDQQAPAQEKKAYGIEMGTKTWAGFMHQKDQHMRALFGDRPSRTAM